MRILITPFIQNLHGQLAAGTITEEGMNYEIKRKKEGNDQANPI